MELFIILIGVIVYCKWYSFYYEREAVRKLTPEQQERYWRLKRFRTQKKNRASFRNEPIFVADSITPTDSLGISSVSAGSSEDNLTDNITRGLWDPASIYYPLFHSNDGMGSGIGLSDGYGLSHFGLDDSFGSSDVRCSGPFDFGCGCGCGIGSGLDESTHW